MARFNTGGNVVASGAGMFLKPDKAGTTAWLLTDKDGIRWTSQQVQCFEQQGKPTNVTWIKVGPDDPSVELGLKNDAYAAWVPVAVKGDNGWEVKFWQTNKTNHAAIVALENDWPQLPGTRIKISFISGRWTVAALPPLAKGGPTKDEIAELIASIPDDDAFGAMVGPDTADGVRQLLMKRLNVQTWNQVLTAFGKGGSASEDIEVEDV